MSQIVQLGLRGRKTRDPEMIKLTTKIDDIYQFYWIAGRHFVLPLMTPTGKFSSLNMINLSEMRYSLRIKGYKRKATIAFSEDSQSLTVAIHGVFYGGQNVDWILKNED